MIVKKPNPLDGLYTVTAKGKTYHYAWRNGPRIEAEFGTTEFLQEFIDARAPTNAMDEGRFGTWVVKYKESDSHSGGKPYKQLSEKTKKNWGPLLDKVRDHFGKLPVRAFDRPSIRKVIKQFLAKWNGKLRAQDLAKQVLSRVCGFMVEEGVLMTNPCEGISNVYSSDRSEIIWTQADIDKFCAAASTEVSHAVLLAALTGMRQSDLLKLTWTQVAGTYIERKTGKSGGKRSALVPIYSALRAFLDTLPKRAVTVLTTTEGKPWKTGFGASFAAAFDRAFGPDKDLHFHDLRGTAVTNFYRAGLTSREIADVMAWSQEDVEKLLDIYCKRDELMLDRIAKMDQFQNARAAR